LKRHPDLRDGVRAYLINDLNGSRLSANLKASTKERFDPEISGLFYNIKAMTFKADLNNESVKKG